MSSINIKETKRNYVCITIIFRVFILDEIIISIYFSKSTNIASFSVYKRNFSKL